MEIGTDGLEARTGTTEDCADIIERTEQLPRSGIGGGARRKAGL